VSRENFDVAIIGGGPAGLSAALVLGRCRRRVIVLDSGEYRNQHARAVQGYLTRDGTPPGDLRSLARAEIGAYPSVAVRQQTVARVVRVARGFEVQLRGASSVMATLVLLATGMADEQPDIEGVTGLLGTAVHQCAHCNGWELRDLPLASYDRKGLSAVYLAQWSTDVVLCTDGEPDFDASCRALLARRGVRVETRRIARFVAEAEGVRLVFQGGATLWRRAVFMHHGCRQRSAFAEQLGCRYDDEGGIWVDRHGATDVPGVYAAGDASRDVLLAIVAAGEGAAAAVAMNAQLTMFGA
jgi:thioredoxin reductase